MDSLPFLMQASENHIVDGARLVAERTAPGNISPSSRDLAAGAPPVRVDFPRRLNEKKPLRRISSTRFQIQLIRPRNARNGGAQTSHRVIGPYSRSGTGACSLSTYRETHSTRATNEVLHVERC